MTEPAQHNSNTKPYTPTTTSWPQKVTFGFISIAAGVGVGHILKNREVTDDSKTLVVSAGVAIVIYNILNTLFRQKTTTTQLSEQHQIQELNTTKAEFAKQLKEPTKNSPTSKGTSKTVTFSNASQNQQGSVPNDSPPIAKEIFPTDEKPKDNSSASSQNISENNGQEPPSILKLPSLPADGDSDEESDSSYSVGDASFESTKSGYNTSGSEGSEAEGDSSFLDQLDPDF